MKWTRPAAEEPVGPVQHEHCGCRMFLTSWMWSGRSASENEHTKKPTRKTVKQLVMTQIYICGRAATSSGRSVYSGSKGGSEKKKLKRKWEMKLLCATWHCCLCPIQTKSTVSSCNLLLKLERIISFHIFTLDNFVSSKIKLVYSTLIVFLFLDSADSNEKLHELS